MSNTTQAERNAVAFEMSIAAPGWYSGLLVACSCERTVPGPKRSGSAERKLSVRDFAKASHQTHQIVAAYLDAWESAADEELVPHADELSPDDALAGLEFAPETHTAESWLVYFDALMADKRAKDRAYDEQRRYPKPTPEQIAEAITTDPEVRANPKVRDAVVDVVKTDTKTRQAASRVITDHYREQQRAHPDSADKHRTNEDEFMAITENLRWAKTYLQNTLGKAVNIPLHGDRGEIVLTATKELRALLEAIENLAKGGSFDDELSRLLEEGATG